jgi:hypothetical protein
LLDEIGNELDIIFRKLPLMRVADVSEPLGLPDHPLFVVIGIRHSLLLYAVKAMHPEIKCGESGGRKSLIVRTSRTPG